MALAQWWRGQAREVWDGSQIPSQRGKIAIVTGANSGIGFEVAKRLAERGAHVVLACRSEARGREAENLIVQHLQQLELAVDSKIGKAEFMQVDMGELASIFRQFGVNHIGAFYLTRLLFEWIKKAPAPRVVAVSSLAHRTAKMDFATIASSENARAWGDFSCYASSKMANLLFTYELDRRLKKHAALRHVRAVAAHPGLTHTQIFAKFVVDFAPRVLRWLLLKILFSLPFNSVPVGALPILYVATVESVASGEYFGPDRWGGRVGYPVREISTPASYSEADAKQLWTLSEEIVEGRFDVR
ncbi:hypothetical protein PybrP1_011884 [[Pythium] brassicae (nom. inval.)]|nr:hypothetical protein PybrP1_011884 [[Pythium] brassicae (nom. inval.)]